MKKWFVRAVIILVALPSFAYVAKYKEDFYQLFHVHYQQYPDDVMENIYWLEKAVAADFANPLYAAAKINDERDWEKYRYLFMMHVNLKIIEQYMRLGRTYDHAVAHFYDAPWKDTYIEQLQKTKSCYETGLYYWREAKLWAEKANTSAFRFRWLSDIQHWEDERERISTGKLDYEKILTRELARVQGVIDAFTAMESRKY